MTVGARGNLFRLLVSILGTMHIKIVRMTDSRAAELYADGKRWLGVGMKTKEEAGKKRLAYLSGDSD